VFRDIALFASLSEPELAALSDRAVTRTYPKGTILFSEGDESGSLYVVESGSVRVFLIAEDGREVTLNAHGPGEHFGEIALLDEAPRSASVATLARSRITTLAKADFVACLLEHPGIALAVIRHLSGIVRALTDNVRSLALLDVYGRVARTLLNLATEDASGRLVIDGRVTHQAIANRIGASREMVGRIMKDLTGGGYIRIEKDRITIERKLPSRW
jgi:CRP/FNR family transcriptional regulator, cyclic AMP receptor protein